MATAREMDFANFDVKGLASYYGDLRKILYDELNLEYPQFTCTPINFNDALQADKWRHVEPGVGRDEWKWVDAHQQYTRKSGFKRFDLSVKNGGFVAGLAYGAPSKTKTQLKINIIEATPFAHHKRDTKIFEVISHAAQLYAALLGADEIRIMNPLNDDLTDYYCSYGYEFVAPKRKKLGVYCSMKIET